jgi:hypothetical protein
MSEEQGGFSRRLWLGLALAAATAEAHAQFGGSRSGRRGGKDGDGARRGVDAQPATLEITLHELGEDLHLTPAQQPLWDSYADKVRALAADALRERTRAKSVSELKLLPRLDHMLDVERNKLTALEDIVQAAKTLYASLAPEQQAAADPRLANIVFLPALPNSPAKK